MKKILLAFLLLNSISFANWKTIELIDGFQDKTGQVSAIASMNEGFIRLDKTNPMCLFVSFDDYISADDDTIVKIKIDNNEPHSIYGIFSKDGQKIFIDNENDIFLKIIEEMKKGNEMKILVTKYDGTPILRKVSLKNFTNSYSKIK